MTGATRSRWRSPALFLNIGLWCLGLIIGIFMGISHERENEASAEREHHAGQLEFINPILDCGDHRALSNRELASFNGQLREVVKQEQARLKVKSLSVYFRDLGNGPWFGINEEERFIPASLLKVPLLMAVLRRAEDDPSFIRKKFTYTGEDLDRYESFKSRAQVQKGKTYSVEELLFFMIVHSDNNAAALLLDDDRGAYFRRVFDDLGIRRVEEGREQYDISVKTYGSFFRILYNASYLNREMSNSALSLLTQNDFRRGLSHPIPRNIPVAHKFGERSLGTEKQFHDCGIVYYPSRPYLLCVMSRGDDYEDLVSSVESISSFVFAEVDKRITAVP